MHRKYQNSAVNFAQCHLIDITYILQNQILKIEFFLVFPEITLMYILLNSVESYLYTIGAHFIHILNF